jgi:hypothetical protein
MKDSAFAEAKTAIVAMAAEANELQQAVGGSITEVVAGWLAPQYAVAAREQLAELKGERLLKLLRAFVQDWALLRHGDQTAERLRIERERLAVASRDVDLKWKPKIIIGLEMLAGFADKHPEAKAAMAELFREIAAAPISNAEKIAQLRRHYFADVDALEKSGSVVLPP